MLVMLQVDFPVATDKGGDFLLHFLCCRLSSNLFGFLSGYIEGEEDPLEEDYVY